MHHLRLSIIAWMLLALQNVSVAADNGLTSSRSQDDAVFWSGKSFWLFDTLSHPSKALSMQCPSHDDSELYFPSIAESMQYGRYGTLVSFLLRRSFTDDQGQAHVPVELVKERGQDFACVLNAEDVDDVGLVYQYLPSSQILSQGLYHSSVRALPQNGSLYDKAALSLSIMPRFWGLRSDSERLKPWLSYERHGKDNQIFFSGSELKAFLNSERKLSRIELYENNKGEIFLPFENTLLSGSDYINYGFYTEPEMLILKDLGYELRPREFIGNTIWSEGSVQELCKREIKSGFYAYSERSGGYDVSRPSVLPLTVGTHVMGSYNNIVQSSSLAAVGAGSLGVRIDGSGNIFTQEPHSSFVVNGYDSAAVAVVYGHDNQLDLKGKVIAEGTGGIGVLMSFGSNLNSDLFEYRGSYLRVKEGVNAEVPAELAGPLVSDLRISGTVSGKEAGIFIGDLAHVSHIRLENGAMILGGIVSKWEPYFDNDNFKVVPKESSHTTAGTLNLDKLPSFDAVSSLNFLKDRLHTKIFLGERSGSLGDLAHPDPHAHTNIQGGIDGKSLDVVVSGGHASIRGSVDIASLVLRPKVELSLATGGSFSQATDLEMRDHSALNFVNGVGDRLEIKEKAYFADGTTLRLDAHHDGSVADSIILPEDSTVQGGKLLVEPGLSYAQIRSFNASPRDFMRFMERFVSDVRKQLGDRDFNVGFPKHVWYEHGELGMEVKCSSRGCRAGRFISNLKTESSEESLWRYCLSGAGSVLLLFLLFLYFSYEKHNGADRRLKRAEHELSAIMKTDEARG